MTKAQRHLWSHSEVRAQTAVAQPERVRKSRLGYALVALVLCLLPLERWEFPYNVRIADLGLVLMLAYGLARLLHSRRSMHFPLALPMWLVIFASLVATCTGSGHSNSIIAIIQEVYLFTWFVVLANLLTELGPAQLDSLMKVWSVVALLEATATLMGMLDIGPAIFHASGPAGEAGFTGTFRRAIGTFVNPNAAACYLSISFFVLLATRWPFWMRSLLGVWLLAGIYATGSMGALLSTAIGLAALILAPMAMSHQRLAPMINIAAVATSALVAIMAIDWLQLASLGGNDLGACALFSTTLARLPRSVAGRMDLVKEGWATYCLHPLGTGPNTAVLHWGSLHNDYLAFLFERGPLGALGWLWLVSGTLRAALRAAHRRTGALRRSMLSLGAGFLACVVNAFTHEVSHFRQLWVLMAFLFAASHVLPARCASAASSEEGMAGES